MDTDISHEVEKRLSRLEEAVGLPPEGADEPPESDEDEDEGLPGGPREE